MILYEMLQNVNPEIVNHIDKRAEQLDGTYLISKSEERMDYVFDFFACYKTNTTYIPVSSNIEQHHLHEIESKSKYLTDDIAAVYSTSGTTGKVQATTVVCTIAQAEKSLNLDENDETLGGGIGTDLTFYYAAKDVVWVTGLVAVNVADTPIDALQASTFTGTGY